MTRAISLNARSMADGSVDQRLTERVAFVRDRKKLNRQWSERVFFFDRQESVSVATPEVVYGEYYFLVMDSRTFSTGGTLEAILRELLRREWPEDAPYFGATIETEPSAVSRTRALSEACTRLETTVDGETCA